MSENYLKQLRIYDQKPPLQNHKIKMHYFRFDGFSFGGLLEYILQHALAKFQPATTCNSQNTSQNTQKHQKHAILLSKPVALYRQHNFCFGLALAINKLLKPQIKNTCLHCHQCWQQALMNYDLQHGKCRY